MNNNIYNSLIKNSIRDLILEKGEILTKGAFGTGGRSKAFVANAKARAEADPKGLMTDLGISSSVGGTDLQKVQKILNAAIHTNSVMSQAYRGTKIAKDIPRQAEEEVEVVAIMLGSLDRKNGLRYLAHTLRAAANAGFLSLEKSVQFAQGSKHEIIIHSV
jgi:hypothetical protein